MFPSPPLVVMDIFGRITPLIASNSIPSQATNNLVLKLVIRGNKEITLFLYSLTSNPYISTSTNQGHFYPWYLEIRDRNFTIFRDRVTGY